MESPHHLYAVPAGPRQAFIAAHLRRVLLGVMATLLMGCAGLPANPSRPDALALKTPQDTPLGQWLGQRRAESRSRNDSAFHLLDTEENAFAARLALIDAARQTLDLQYYAIHADNSTELLLQRLRSAAARGVRVRLLLDDLNSAGRDAQVLRLAFEPRIEVRLFNPLPGARSSLPVRLFGALQDFHRLQKRMHNKLFLADNTLGIAGGRNLGDAYFGRGQLSNFVDLDVLAAGRIVRDMSASFDRYWNNEQAYPVQALMSRDDLEALRARPPEDALPLPQAPPATLATTPAILPDLGTATLEVTVPLSLQRLTLTWASASLLVDQPGKIGPDDDEAEAADTVVDGLLNLMRQARSDVLIVSPYFIPGPQLTRLFAELRARGVRVRVLTNSLASNDAPAAHAGYARHRQALLALGVELHELRSDQRGSLRGLSALGSRGNASGTGSSARASLHSKAVIVDGRTAVIGSMNLDLRSQNLNTEVALLIRSATLAAEAIRLIEETLATGTWRVELVQGQLKWRAPAGAGYADADNEPDASAPLKWLVRLIGPFAPDDIL